MAKQVTETDGALRAYALRLLDSVYNVSVYSVIGYSALLGVLAVIGLAIFMKIIYVPEFHPW
ncbi:hypothetical protein [Methylocystis sp.]|uniref:hypothetical protein n=1 Tax=Methylocystis sp. TaxID=1911079 RepID=UPI0011DC4ADF|nr:hypothetical protein [Methylocystis sp.]KAF0133075.1 MAG: hypothetical protein FD148_1213 [Methylocystaceae bacterium]KAF0210876.1 MAG: hypothetical protein FD172_2354 [Methylocystaceae bacterium]MDP3555203.1 hypothetical protein [Methylocystis sp.]TXT46508.1 MAG: hypothetical protein FD139_958 [Methylocystaceae bacterium]